MPLGFHGPSGFLWACQRHPGSQRRSSPPLTDEAQGGGSLAQEHTAGERGDSEPGVHCRAHTLTIRLHCLRQASLRGEWGAGGRAWGEVGVGWGTHAANKMLPGWVKHHEGNKGGAPVRLGGRGGLSEEVALAVLGGTHLSDGGTRGVPPFCGEILTMTQAPSYVAGCVFTTPPPVTRSLQSNFTHFYWGPSAPRSCWSWGYS